VIDVSHCLGCIAERRRDRSLDAVSLCGQFGNPADRRGFPLPWTARDWIPPIRPLGVTLSQPPAIVTTRKPVQIVRAQLACPGVRLPVTRLPPPPSCTGTSKPKGKTQFPAILSQVKRHSNPPRGTAEIHVASPLRAGAGWRDRSTGCLDKADLVGRSLAARLFVWERSGLAQSPPKTTHGRPSHGLARSPTP
jgi:hypothetical protein